MSTQKKTRKKRTKPALRIVDAQSGNGEKQIKRTPSAFASNLQRFCDELDKGIDIILKM